MYVITSVADRGWTHRLVLAIGGAKDADAGRRILADNLPEGLGTSCPRVSSRDPHRDRRRCPQRPAPAGHPR